MRDTSGYYRACHTIIEVSEKIHAEKMKTDAFLLAAIDWSAANIDGHLQCKNIKKILM